MSGSGSADGNGSTASRIDAAVNVFTSFAGSTVGSGAGLVPAGSASAAGPGFVLLALVAGFGLVGVGVLRTTPTGARAGSVWRLLRQPGFSPD